MKRILHLLCISALIVAMVTSLVDDDSDDEYADLKVDPKFDDEDDDDDGDFLALINLEPNELMPDFHLPKDSKIVGVIKGQAKLSATAAPQIETDTVLKLDTNNTLNVNNETNSGILTITAIKWKLSESTSNKGNETNTNNTSPLRKWSRGKKCTKIGYSKRNCRHAYYSKFGLQKTRRQVRKKIALERWRETNGHLEGKISHFCSYLNKDSISRVKKSRQAYMDKKLAKLPAEKRQSIKEDWIHHRQELQKCCQLALNEQKTCVEKIKLERINKVCNKEAPICPFIAYHLGDKAPIAENYFMKCCEIKDGEEKLSCFRTARREMQKLKFNNKEKRMKRKMKL